MYCGPCTWIVWTGNLSRVDNIPFLKQDVLVKSINDLFVKLGGLLYNIQLFKSHKYYVYPWWHMMNRINGKRIKHYWLQITNTNIVQLKNKNLICLILSKIELKKFRVISNLCKYISYYILFFCSLYSYYTFVYTLYIL